MQENALNHRNAFARFATAAAMTLLAGAIVAGTVGCDSEADSPESPDAQAAGTGETSTGNSNASQEASNGFTLESGDLTIDATTSAALMPAAPQGELAFRLMAGWVDTAAAARAGQESDEQAQREQGLRSFGTMTLNITASSAEPGTYELASALEGERAAVIVIPQEEDLGLTSEYTSASGTLTLEDIEVGSGPLRQVKRVTGSFDGTFVDDEDNERPFRGTFRFVPRD